VQALERDGRPGGEARLRVVLGEEVVADEGAEQCAPEGLGQDFDLVKAPAVSRFSLRTAAPGLVFAFTAFDRPAIRAGLANAARATRWSASTSSVSFRRRATRRPMTVVAAPLKTYFRV
jgi:hypothetical protein